MFFFVFVCEPSKNSVSATMALRRENFMSVRKLLCGLGNVIISAMRKVHYNSPVILTYALLSLAVLGLNYITGGASNRHFMLRPTNFFDPFMYVRMFTSAIGHANWSHFFGNFFMMLLIGPAMEERYGSVALLKMITVTAFVTGVIHAFMDMNTIGASGILFMLILLASVTNFKKGRIPLTFILVAVLYLGREIHSSIHIGGNISYIGHIAGGVCGAALGFFANSKASNNATE
jgi:membrane associated rhomboid family serine protease